MNGSTRRWSVWLHRLIPFVVLLVFGVAVTFLVRTFGKYSREEIFAAIEAIPRYDLLAAVMITAIAYCILSTYDLMGLRYIGSKLPKRQAFYTAFTAFAFSNNIGLASIAGSSLRLRLYSAQGLQPTQILKVIAFVSLTFWIGFLTIAGFSMLVEPVSLPAGYSISQSLSTTLGCVALSLTAAYIGLCRYFRRPILISGQLVKLPSPGLALTQAVTAAFDWMLAAAVLYLLVPHDHIGYFVFLSIFVSAQIIALMSHVPGGVGVLEALVIYFMSTDHEPSAAVLGGLLVYRLIYYIAPLLIAAVMFVSHEIARKRRAPIAAIIR